MPTASKPYEMITDFVTGKEIPNMGAEVNRQRMEHILVEQKGYPREAIEVNAPIHLQIGEATYDSVVDLVVRMNGKRFMLIKCAAGALGSRHRETLAAARLLDAYQIPFAVVTNGETAQVLDTLTGQLIGEGLDVIPSQEEAQRQIENLRFEPCPEAKKEREKIIFRSYDEMNINVQRKIKK
jgi:hypothetical protein